MGNPSARESRGSITVRPRPGLGTVRGSKERSGVSLDSEVGGPRPLCGLRPLPPLRDPILHPPPLSASLATTPRRWRPLDRFMHTGWLDAAMGV